MSILLMAHWWRRWTFTGEPAFTSRCHSRKFADASEIVSAKISLVPEIQHYRCSCPSCWIEDCATFKTLFYCWCSYTSKRLGVKFDVLAESLMPSLIALLPNSARVMSSSAAVTITFIIAVSFSLFSRNKCVFICCTYFMWQNNQPLGGKVRKKGTIASYQWGKLRVDSRGCV